MPPVKVLNAVDAMETGFCAMPGDTAAPNSNVSSIRIAGSGAAVSLRQYTLDDSRGREAPDNNLLKVPDIRKIQHIECMSSCRKHFFEP